MRRTGKNVRDQTPGVPVEQQMTRIEGARGHFVKAVRQERASAVSCFRSHGGLE